MSMVEEICVGQAQNRHAIRPIQVLSNDFRQ